MMTLIEYFNLSFLTNHNNTVLALWNFISRLMSVFEEEEKSHMPSNKKPHPAFMWNTLPLSPEHAGVSDENTPDP